MISKAWYLRVIFRTVILFAAPLAEFMFIRYYLLRFFAVNFAFENFSGYDVLLPSLFALALFLHLAEQQTPFQFRLQKIPLAVNLLSLIVFVLSSQLFFASVASRFFFVTAVIWIGSLSFITLSAWCFMVPATAWFYHPRRAYFFPCLFIAFSIVIGRTIFGGLWPWYGPATRSVVCGIVPALLSNAHCSTPQSTAVGAFVMNHPLYRILIGYPCSGIDGFTLFLVLLSIFLCIEGKRFGILARAVIFLSGLMLMFLLNIIRMVSIFTVGIWEGRLFHNPQVSQVVRFLFHSNAGWIIYALGLWLFFKAVSLFAARESV